MNLFTQNLFTSVTNQLVTFPQTATSARCLCLKGMLKTSDQNTSEKQQRTLFIMPSLHVYMAFDAHIQKVGAVHLRHFPTGSDHAQSEQQDFQKYYIY